MVSHCQATKPRRASALRPRGDSRSRAQVSLEYLMILGVSLGVLIPASYLFYTYSQDSSDQVMRSKLDGVGTTILSESRKVYGFGQGNRITLDIDLPSSVKNVTIFDGTELVLTYESRQGLQEAVYFSGVNITGAYLLDGSPCPGMCAASTWTVQSTVSGPIALRIESMGEYVLLNQTIS